MTLSRTKTRQSTFDTSLIPILMDPSPGVDSKHSLIKTDKSTLYGLFRKYLNSFYFSFLSDEW
jgi:hypothetical protein